MKILQIAACLLCIWLVGFRQENIVRFLVKPPGMGTCPENTDCCYFTYDYSYPSTKEALKPTIQRAKVYVNNIEGTTIYVLSAPYWTERQAQQNKKKLHNTVAEFQRIPKVGIRVIDEGSTPRRPWQLFAGMAGLLFLTGATRIHPCHKAGLRK